MDLGRKPVEVTSAQRKVDIRLRDGDEMPSWTSPSFPRGPATVAEFQLQGFVAAKCTLATAQCSFVAVNAGEASATLKKY